MMFFASNFGGALGSWINVSQGMSVLLSRKVVNTVGYSCTILSLLLMPMATQPRQGVLFITMTLSALGLSRGGWAVNHMDIAPRHAGVVMAIANGAGTIAGVVGVTLTGKILEKMGGTEEVASWTLATGVVACVCLTAMIAFLLMARGEVLFH